MRAQGRGTDVRLRFAAAVKLQPMRHHRIGDGAGEGRRRNGEGGYRRAATKRREEAERRAEGGGRPFPAACARRRGRTILHPLALVLAV